QRQLFQLRQESERAVGIADCGLRIADCGFDILPLDFCPQAGRSPQSAIRRVNLPPKGDERTSGHGSEGEGPGAFFCLALAREPWSIPLRYSNPSARWIRFRYFG